MSERFGRIDLGEFALRVLAIAAILTLLWFLLSPAFGAEKPIDPAVALAWATPLPAKPVVADSFIASDGVRYERHPDGVYRRAAVQPSVPVVAPGQPFSGGCGCTPDTNCGASFCKSRGGTGCPATCPVKK